MFKEDTQALAASERAATIASGDYEVVIVGVNQQKAKPGGYGSFVITFAIADGDYEGVEYPWWLTQSPNAVGMRASFYRNIGYVRPEDGCVDENDFVGQPAKITLVNNDGQVKVMRVNKSEKLVEGPEAEPADEFNDA